MNYTVSTYIGVLLSREDFFELKVEPVVCGHGVGAFAFCPHCGAKNGQSKNTFVQTGACVNLVGEGWGCLDDVVDFSDHIHYASTFEDEETEGVILGVLLGVIACVEQDQVLFKVSGTRLEQALSEAWELLRICGLASSHAPGLLVIPCSVT